VGVRRSTVGESGGNGLPRRGSGSDLGGRTDLLVRLAPAVIAAGVVLLLAAFVDVDPARGVTRSQSPFSDESWNLINARNFVVFGRFATDEWAMYLLTLPFTIAQTTVFALFGPGIEQARLVDIACVGVTVWLLAAGLRRPFGTTAALLGALAYGLSTLVLFYGRLAFLEPMTAMFPTAAVVCVARATGPRPLLWGTVAGICFALAVGTKLTALVAIPAVFIAVAVVAIRERSARLWLVAACLTLVAFGAVWAVFVLLPNGQAVRDVVSRIYPPPSPALSPIVILRRVARYVLDRGDPIVGPSLPLLVGGLSGAVAVVAARRRVEPVAVLLAACAGAWFLTTVTALVVLGFGHNRYFVLALPALAILTAAAVSVALASPRWPEQRSLGIAAVGGLALALTVPGLWSYAGWMRNGTRVLPLAQAKAVALVPSDAVVAGPYAALLAMRTQAETVVTCCGTNPVNAGDLYELAHARFWAAPWAPDWAGRHPDAWAQRQTLLCIPWHDPPASSCLSRLP